MLAASGAEQLRANTADALNLVHPGGLGFGLPGRIELYGRIRHTPGAMIGDRLELISRLTGQTQAVGIPWVVEDPSL